MAFSIIRLLILDSLRAELIYRLSLHFFIFDVNQDMAPLFTRERKTRIRVFAIVAVYLVRMAFFQSLIASPVLGQPTHFKHSLAQHQSKNVPHVPVVHRSHFQKHVVAKIRVPLLIPSDAFQSTMVIPVEPLKIYSLRFYHPPVFKHLAGDALKRYRLHCTFLI